MASDLSVYVNGKYHGKAGACAKQVCLHTDESEYTLDEAVERFGYNNLWRLQQELQEKGKDTSEVKVSVRDENKY